MRGVAVVLALLALAVPCLGAPAQPQSEAARYYQSLSAAAQQPAAAAAPLDPAAQKLAAALQERFGVQVLAARPEQANGKTVYRMVVMNPGGNFDEAYAVHTLVVDAASGALVPQFRNETSGYRLAAAPDRTPRNNAVATTIRRESFSKP